MSDSLNTYEISYHSNWSDKPVWNTEVQSETLEKAKEKFKQFYPFGVIKKINIKR